MTRIISVAKQRGRGAPLKVTLDGNVTAEIDGEVAGLYGVRDGREYGGGEWREILLLSARKRAKDLALGALSRKPLSETQLRRTLRSKHVTQALVEEVIADLRRTGLVNDREFARHLCEELIQRKRVGPLRLKQELFTRGVGAEMSEEILATAYAQHEPVTLARELLARKRYGPELADDPARRKKAADMLRRRGFSWEVVGDALAGLTEENG